MSTDIWLDEGVYVSHDELIERTLRVIAVYRKHVWVTLAWIGFGILIPYALAYFYVWPVVVAIICSVMNIMLIAIASHILLPRVKGRLTFTNAFLERGLWTIWKPTIVPHTRLSPSQAKIVCEGLNPNNFVRISPVVHLFRNDNDAILFKLGIGRAQDGAEVVC